jgi:hypothetical protein
MSESSEKKSGLVSPIVFAELFAIGAIAFFTVAIRLQSSEAFVGDLLATAAGVIFFGLFTVVCLAVIGIILYSSITHGNGLVDKIGLLEEEKKQQKSDFEEEEQRLRDLCTDLETEKQLLENRLYQRGQDLLQARRWLSALSVDFKKLIVSGVQMATDFRDSRGLPSDTPDEPGVRLVTSDRLATLRRGLVNMALSAQRVWGNTEFVQPDEKTGPVFELMPILEQYSRPDVVSDVVDELLQTQKLPADPENPQPWEAAFQHFGTQGLRVCQAKRLIKRGLRDDLIKCHKALNGRIVWPKVGWYDWYQLIMAMDQELSQVDGQRVLLEDRGFQICSRHLRDGEHLEDLTGPIHELSSFVHKRLSGKYAQNVFADMIYLVYRLLYQYPHLLPHYVAVETEEVDSRLMLHPNSEDAQKSLTQLWVQKAQAD